MALTSHLAGAAASHAMRGAGQQASQAIGKPLDGLSSHAAARGAAHNDINWVDFNYPPGLALVHYDNAELPTAISGLVRSLNVSFILTSVACALNLLDTLIIHFSSKAPARWILQSVIHLVLLPAAALGVFYAGYRGIAEPDTTLLFRFKVGQPGLAFVYFLFAVVPWGCANGLSAFGEIKEFAPGGHTWWTLSIIAESCLWLGNSALSALNAVRVQRYDAYGTMGSRV